MRGYAGVMPYDEALADRIRAHIPAGEHTAEIKMFGGLCWTSHGHMIVGLTRSQLMVPVGRDGMPNALARGAEQLRMGERVMSGFVGVADPTDQQIDEWVAESAARVANLPPKQTKPAR